MGHRYWTAVLAIAVALPSAATAAPSLRALIVDGRMNPYHDWKKVSPLLKQQLEETGLFTVDVATAPPRGQDLSGFQPDFAAYDVVVMNYEAEPWPEATRQAFARYVRDGGGVVIYHSADNAFPHWPEYNEMIGVGGWNNRSKTDGSYVRWRDGQMVLDPTPGVAGTHGPQHEFPLIVRAPNHPITKGLPPVFMQAADELYSRLRGPAKNLTVLATAFSPPDKNGSGEHEPMLMAIRYGKGHVFHTALGHGVPQVRSVAFIVTYQRGAEWAATGKVTQQVPDDFPGPDQPRFRP